MKNEKIIKTLSESELENISGGGKHWDMFCKEACKTSADIFVYAAFTAILIGGLALIQKLKGIK